MSTEDHRGDLRGSERDQMAALISVTPDLRTVSTAHIPFEFMDGCRLRSADDVQGDCLMRVAAKAFHFEIEVASIETSPRAGDG
jgi:predicted Ser/Thr protein kinase